MSNLLGHIGICHKLLDGVLCVVCVPDDV